MEKRKILVLDYSVDRLETPNIITCLPSNIPITSYYIDTETSFPNNPLEEEYTHVIHSGSAHSITNTAPFTVKAMEYIRALDKKGIWQMGICYGHQLICKSLLGDKVVGSSLKGFEVGWKTVKFSKTARILFNCNENEQVWQHHFDEVVNLPEGSEILVSNDHSTIQAYINYDRCLLGTQFHPEFDRERGNNYFLNDRKFIEEKGMKVDEIIKEGPSFNVQGAFFNFFLEQEAVSHSL